MRQDFQLLLKGLDTVQCACYLLPEGKGRIDFELLGLERERIRASKRKDTLGELGACPRIGQEVVCGKVVND